MNIIEKSSDRVSSARGFFYSDSPACRIFVFQSTVYQLAKAKWVSLCTEKMPAFFAAGFTFFNEKSFSL